MFDSHDDTTADEEVPDAPVDPETQSDEDRVFGTRIEDFITGGAADQEISGLEGEDTLDGAGGDDTLLGGDGDDDLRGGTGEDALFGDEGDDSLSGGDGDDELTGNNGDDTLNGGAGDDRLAGNAADDLLIDSDGADKLFGQKGDDTLIAVDDVLGASGILIGGEGDDILRGNDGDTLTGGEGRDFFEVVVGQPGAAPVVIEDLFDGAPVPEPVNKTLIEFVIFVTPEGDLISGDDVVNNLSIGEGDDGNSVVLLFDDTPVAIVNGIDDPDDLNFQSLWIGNFSPEYARPE